MTKLIRVSKKTYEKLHVLAGRLQVKYKKPICLDETIVHILKPVKKGKKYGKMDEKPQNMQNLSRVEIG